MGLLALHLQVDEIGEPFAASRSHHLQGGSNRAE
jgi:hypothetical protein